MENLALLCHFLCLIYMALMALSKAKRATPTSANMANQIDEIPKKASTIIKNLTPRANTMFSITILFVFLAIIIAVAIFTGLSFI